MRRKQARDLTIQGNTFDAIAKPESFSLLYLKSPYDFKIGSIANRRMEAVFLEHTYRWLVMEGVLVFVIPFERLHDCAGILSSHFGALDVFPMTDPDSVQYRQIVVLGVRRDVRGAAVEKSSRPLECPTAGQRGISVRRLPNQKFVKAVSRLSDGVVDLDPVEELLVALGRAGVITSFQRGLLQVHYLR